MSLQYIIDSDGQTTGVFIPIQQWNQLKDKYPLEQQDAEVPKWHQEIVRQRMEDYQNHPAEAVDFEKAMDEIEKAL